MCEHSQLQIIIIWILGHCEIEGNERADAEVKKAATDPSLGQTFRHNPLKSAWAGNIKMTAKGQWQKQWSEGIKTAIILRYIMKRRGIKAGVKFYNMLLSR